MAESTTPIPFTTPWRIVGPSNKPLSCVTVRYAYGFEVRAGCSDLDLLRSERVTSPAVGAMLAAAWKAAAMELGSFSDLDATN